jgi:hypothetical protein
MDTGIIKKYKDLATKKSDNYDNIIKAIDIVKTYIFRNKKIIVGGIAIDYALKLKSHKGIYDENVIPDFDIISDMHFQDAYNIATLLSKKDFTGISVINALHPSTMKVRVDFVEVCDITYVPKNILDHVPCINYHGFQLVHPHYQYIDQHRSLSHPYENAPYETIMHRPEKDMVRHDLLYNYYPLRILYTKNTQVNLHDYSVDLKILENQCISGFFALNYWIEQAKSLGFQTNLNFGNNTFTNNKVLGKIPVESSGIVLYTNDITNLYNLIPNKTDVKFYAKLLDKLQRRIIMKNYELIDLDQKITAHEINKFGVKMHVANLQSIMLYLLINYIIIQKISGNHRMYPYYAGYIISRDIITWAGKQYISTKNSNLHKFLPTSEVFGERNISDSYVVSKHNFDVKNKTIDISEKNKYTQPRHVYDRDLLYKKTPKKYYEFNVNDSEIFNFNGEEVNNFL